MLVGKKDKVFCNLFLLAIKNRTFSTTGFLKTKLFEYYYLESVNKLRFLRVYDVN